MALTNHILPDSPTNNFCTLNPLTTYNPTLSDGNLYSSIGASYKWGVGTILIPSTGKWIFEILFLTNTSSNNYNSGGVITSSFDQSQAASSAGFYGINDAGTFGSSFIQNGTRQGSITLPANTLIQCIIDRDAGELTFTKDGTLQTGTGSTVTLPNSEVPLMAAIGDFSVNIITNFGQDPTFGGASTLPTGAGDYDTDASGNSTGGRFAFQPPTGALALCTANLPDFTPDVTGDIPADYFTVRKWHNNVDNVNQDFDLGFDADLLWVKRTNGTDDNRLYDSLRGANNFLVSNDTGTSSSVDYGIYFLNGDQKLTTDSTKYYGYGPSTSGGSGNAFVAWCFRAGGAPSGSTSTTGSAKRINTSGTQDDTSCSALATAATNAGASNVITPTLMSINQASGFSIVKYTGTGANATVPHGLSSAPEFVVIKGINTGYDWVVYHDSVSSMNTKRLLLNEPTEATDQSSGPWNSTSPNSNVVSIGTHLNVNEGTEDFIMYCWHSVEGYSKFGSYTGNGSADGPFVYCGFRVGWLMVKRTDGAGSWVIHDSARNPYNEVEGVLNVDASTEEKTYSTTGVDFLSNGFKLRGNSSWYGNNLSTQTAVFMAFAEQPFKFSNAR